jgi:hypothetical protein
MEQAIAETMLWSQVSDAIHRMLLCMSSRNEQNCERCRDADACSFLTEAVFAYKYKRTIRKPLQSY